MAYSIEGVEGLPEIQQDDDLAELIAAAAELEDGDILVVTSKIVSKSEGRIVQADDREAAITAETVRVVATREHEGGVTRIVENRQGIIGAAAGVDASNAPHGTVLLLPIDPDASARALATGLRALTGRHVDVSTKFGSVRKGVLTLVGPLAINVQLDKEEGGLLLTMPADSITEIKYTPVESVPVAPPATAQQAKAP